MKINDASETDPDIIKKIEPSISVKSTIIEEEKEHLKNKKNCQNLEKPYKISDTQADIDESIPIREQNDYCYNICRIF